MHIVCLFRTVHITWAILTCLKYSVDDIIYAFFENPLPICFHHVCDGDGSDLQSALAEWTGQRTVPNVFVKGERIGGCDGESLPSEVLLLLPYCSYPLSVPEWLAHLRLNFVLNVVLPPPEQRPWQCTTVGSWCLCWRRLEQLVPPALQLRLCWQHSARLVVTCKCCATTVVVVIK